MGWVVEFRGREGRGFGVGWVLVLGVLGGGRVEGVLVQVERLMGGGDGDGGGGCEGFGNGG